MIDFGNAGKWTKRLLEEAIKEGSVVVDATMGNGHDTKYLAELVGESGHVYAFDIQPQALVNTRKRLEDAGLLDRTTLILDSHEKMGEHVPVNPDVIVFNLGWLPGAEHVCTTRCETTLLAVNAALALLKRGGLLTICVYPGHPEGLKELDMLMKWVKELDDTVYDAFSQGYENIRLMPPRLIAVTKK